MSEDTATPDGGVVSRIVNVFGLLAVVFPTASDCETVTV